MVAYLQETGKKLGVETLTDEVGNVLMRKPATPGKEKVTPIIFQAHMDMVCEKNNDVNFDFEKDAIQTYIDGEWMKAKGTTLGADDGTGNFGEQGYRTRPRRVPFHRGRGDRTYRSQRPEKGFFEGKDAVEPGFRG